MRREYDFNGGVRGKHAGRSIRIVGDTRPKGSTTKAGRKDSDLLSRLLETKQVTVSWVHEDTEGYFYRNVPGTIVPNRRKESLRFELTEKNGDDDNFEVIIRKQNGSFILKADHPEMKNHEYSLKEYSSSDELVFYLQDEGNRAYFHLS